MQRAIASTGLGRNLAGAAERDRRLRGGGVLREQLQHGRPTGRGIVGSPDCVCAGAVSLEAAVLQFDSRLRRTLRYESHLHFAGVRRVRVVLPLLVELPREQQALRRFVREHAPRIALRAILVELVPPAADLWLEYEVRHGGWADVIVLWPPRPEPGGEYFKGALLRRGNSNRPAYRGLDVLTHSASSFDASDSSCSTAIANAARAASHI